MPPFVDSDQLCAVRKVEGSSTREFMLFALYEKDEDILHELNCGAGAHYPSADRLKTECSMEYDNCPIFLLPQEGSHAIFLQQIEDEYGLDYGVTMTLENVMVYFINWVGQPFKRDNPMCSVNPLWNMFIVKDFDSAFETCKDSMTDPRYDFTWSHNHDRGYPLAVMINSYIGDPKILDFVWRGCKQQNELVERGEINEKNTCIRLINSVIRGQADYIWPADVDYAFDSIRQIMKSKKGEEKKTVEVKKRKSHPRQILYFILFGFSFVFLLAVLTSTFVFTKHHDFPTLNQTKDVEKTDEKKETSPSPSPINEDKDFESGENIVL